MLLDEMHANYVCDCEGSYNAEGSVLRYFDSKDERDVFEDGLSKSYSHPLTNPKPNNGNTNQSA